MYSSLPRRHVYSEQHSLVPRTQPTSQMHFRTECWLPVSSVLACPLSWFYLKSYQVWYSETSAHFCSPSEGKKGKISGRVSSLGTPLQMAPDHPPVPWDTPRASRFRLLCIDRWQATQLATSPSLCNRSRSVENLLSTVPLGMSLVCAMEHLNSK